MTIFTLVAVTSRGTQVPLIRVSAASREDALQSTEAFKARALLIFPVSLDAIVANRKGA